jgi:hypothetical protein
MSQVYKNGDLCELMELCRMLGDDRKPLSFEDLKKSVSLRLGEALKGMARTDRALFSCLIRSFLKCNPKKDLQYKEEEEISQKSRYDLIGCFFGAVHGGIDEEVAGLESPRVHQTLLVGYQLVSAEGEVV